MMFKFCLLKTKKCLKDNYKSLASILGYIFSRVHPAKVSEQVGRALAGQMVMQDS